ncbi:MAG: agmatinase [Halobacteriota archaeon]
MKFAGSLSEADKEKASYEIIGVPYDGNAFKKGSREGPKAIRRASHRLETFLWHEKRELSDLLYYDCGDINLDFGQNQNLVFDTHKEKIFIGGDHSISFPLVKHFFDSGEVEKVMVIDAHADFRNVYKSKKLSNACVMRRIAELVGFENIIEVGVRSSSEEEYALIKDKVRIYDAGMVREKGVERVLEEIGKEGGREEKTYLSIDIDVLDPGIAPGVENPEPCGMSLESLIALVRGIMEQKNVVASDVVEVNPGLDNANGITSINAARIVFELLNAKSKL